MTGVLTQGFALGMGYLIGALPIGAVVTRLASGKDVLNEHSGRTGGTNVMRTAGFWAGLATAIGDLLKGYAAVLLAQTLVPGLLWVHVLAGVLAVLGHNQSVFLAQRTANGIRLRGGAGGATSVGAGIALWTPVGFLIALAPILLFGVGYASVATLSVAGLMALALTLAAWAGRIPWPYIGYGFGALVLILYALRPNLDRLRRGEERRVRWPLGKAASAKPTAGHEVV